MRLLHYISDVFLCLVMITSLASCGRNDLADPDGFAEYCYKVRHDGGPYDSLCYFMAIRYYDEHASDPLSRHQVVSGFSNAFVLATCIVRNMPSNRSYTDSLSVVMPYMIARLYTDSVLKDCMDREVSRQKKKGISCHYRACLSGDDRIVCCIDYNH